MTRLTLGHRLPLEVLRRVFRLAAVYSPTTGVRLLCVCKQVNEWVESVLYDCVVLFGRSRFFRFVDAVIDQSSEQLNRFGGRKLRRDCVQSLWLSIDNQWSWSITGQQSKYAGRSIRSTNPLSSNSSLQHSPSACVPSKYANRDLTWDLVRLLQALPNLHHLALVGSPILTSCLQVSAYSFRLSSLVVENAGFARFTTIGDGFSECLRSLEGVEIIDSFGKVKDENTRAISEFSSATVANNRHPQDEQQVSPSAQLDIQLSQRLPRLKHVTKHSSRPIIRPSLPTSIPKHLGKPAECFSDWKRRQRLALQVVCLE